MDVTRLRWQQLGLVVTVVACLLSRHLAAAETDDSEEPQQDMFLPKFLQEGEWGKALNQARPNSESDDMDNPKNGSTEKRAYNNYFQKTAGARKTASQAHGGGVKGIKKPGESSRPLFNGGCKSRPQTPLNAGLDCSIFSGCRAKCAKGYIFPNGEKQLFITCQQGEWQVENAEWDTIPHCEAVCQPACQHSGICVKPNQCDCPDNYAGPQCQFEKKPCLNYPPLPANSRRTCNSKSCNIMCASGHEFPDGSAVANMICREGTWVPSRSEWKSIPDCQPVCKPPCQNGGNCLSFNVCQCPQDFRGPQCQYAASVCSAEKLGINVGYKCKGSDSGVTCSVSCPAGAHFKEQPAAQYVCSYDTGRFLPSPIPECVFDSSIDILPGGAGLFPALGTLDMTNSSTWAHLFDGLFSGENGLKIPFSPEMSVIETRPRPGYCYTWGRSHLKTFDGRLFSFESQCAHTLVLDVVDGTFSVNLQPLRTHSDVKVLAQDKEYTLTLTGDGTPVLQVGSRQVSIPTQMSGVVVDNEAHFVVFRLTGAGLTIKWDGRDYVGVTVTESLWNRTAGLCGLLDGRTSNDFMSKDGSAVHRLTSFINSWKVKPLGAEQCASTPVEAHACTRFKIHADEEEHFQLAEAATAFCNKLLTDPRFAACRNVVDVKPFYEACRWDFCACVESGLRRNECGCQSLAVYVKVCNQHGKSTAIRNWRDDATCPMACSGSRVYLPCGPRGQETCRSVTTPSLTTAPEACEEGCYCPNGTVLHGRRCVSREQCPCQLRGRMFQPGEKVPKDCNTCTCVAGQWICTQVNCGARCGAIGDPHYLTFDGRRFNFMGKCSYYLLKGDNYSIEAENVACAGAISEAMNFAPQKSSEYPSCTKTVTIRMNGHTIKLKQGREVLVDEQDVSQLPFTAAGAYIHIVSSIFLMVDMPNGLQIWWDGVTRVYIDAPASFQGKTKGLCGTFNQNQKDDFLTLEGDIEQDVVAFANKWKTREVCQDIQEKETSTHPCDINAHNRAASEKHCSRLKGALFEGCHWLVDPEPYYQDCLYDLCACQFKVGQCLCPIFAAYAKECAHKGVHIDWRNDIRECGVHCPGGQVYQICGNTCTRSCYDISRNPACKRQCVEGCNCPEGQTIDSNTGECIPVGRCVCQHDGIEYPPAYREVRAGTKGLELCLCRNALWECRPATAEESQEFPKKGSMMTACSRVGNQEFTTCEPAEPVTCKNMHSPPQSSAAICKAGCKCKKGYVLDSHSKKCIKPSECPCHHGGKSYSEGDSIQVDCNTCKCKAGKWTCTQRVCAGICTAWGDSHYKTFDGRIYDFHGICDYVLVKGSLGNDDIFDISIQNVPCGSSGISCSKSITLRVGPPDRQELVTFTREQAVPAHMGRISVREAGLFVFAEVADLGLVLQWDRGTRVYVRMDPKWKDRLKGLCGNYNDDEDDDFQTPSGGLSEVSARLFGDSWRLQSYCPESLDITDTCLRHPNRKLWAMKKCGILKSSLFQPCHLTVQLEPYLERCIFDACGCDLGGDCECLCTAIAAYAQECNIQGVSIKWRSQQLCPVQCDEKCSHYSPCVQTCPKETCDNYLFYNKLNHLCSEEPCVEGCEVTPCPSGKVYNNATSPECVPVASCKTFCMKVNGVTYYEGDVMEEDECHKCTCSHQKKVCIGVSCAPPTTLPTTLTPEITVPSTLPPNIERECRSGWSTWLSRDNQKDNPVTDTEALPTSLELFQLSATGGVCDEADMKAIECRVVGTHEHYKETGQDVECSLMNGGLKCVGGCSNYEIRVLCKCPQLCDVTKPNSPHPVDCHLFYHCKDTLAGPEQVEKSCGPHMMYNPAKQVCDWPNAVIALRPECAGTTPTLPATPPSPTPTSPCEEGRVWSSCAVPCAQVCLYYDYALKQASFCSSVDDCVPGCVDASSPVQCPQDFLWRDPVSCVRIADCTCRSHTNAVVKPGEVVKESECEVCQCVDNHYECENWCNKTTAFTEASSMPASTPTPWLPTPTAPSSLTPPPLCAPDMLVHLASLLDHVEFQTGNTLAPPPRDLQRVHVTSSDAVWKPAVNNKDQFLQVDLGALEPVYGTTVWGNPRADEYVTSYHLLYSDNGRTFHYIRDAGNAVAVFRGPADHETQVTQQFVQPVEARYIRWNPLTWHKAIAMKVDVLGCRELTTPTVPTSSARPEICTDEMGLENGMMADEQFSASSVYDDSARFGPAQARKDGETSWVPLTNSRNEWIQFDFLEPRNLSGIVTQGNPDLDSWVESYAVHYSHDGKAWNPVMDVARGAPKVFLANYDSSSPYTNTFDRLLQTQYVRLLPTKWHKNIALRAEVLGCYEPYPTPAVTEEVTSPLPPECVPCPGWQGEESIACACPEGRFWDGTKCVTRLECPCYVGHVAYAVGSMFDTKNCQHCICKVGGSTACKEKECPPCSQGLQKVVTPSCGCVCKPCPTGAVLCPTSNICINATSWCDGVEDCPDDEQDCTTTTTPPTTPITPVPTQPSCPETKCPPGYDVKNLEHTKNMEDTSAKFKGRFKGVKGSRARANGGTKKLMLPKPQTKHVKGPECPEFTCVTRNCSKPLCPEDHVLHVKWRHPCPEYTCTPIERPTYATCSSQGRSLRTFDGTEFKLELCNHVLARDLDNNNWDVSVYKDCPSKASTCTTHLLILLQDQYEIRLHPDFSVHFNGYKYTAEQLRKIGSELRRSFTLMRMGSALVFQSQRFRFQIIWDGHEDIQIAVPVTSAGGVDGLCGFFDGNLANDKLKPDGRLARTTTDFGNSWVNPNLEVSCKPSLCPPEPEEEARRICALVRDTPFSQCRGVVNEDKFVSRCAQTVCSCLQAANASACRCQALLAYVTECLTADRSLDLSSWRVQHDCPAPCPPPLVHHDCYPQRCEPSCDGLKEDAQCAAMPGTCLAGCFCPDGLVHKDDKCVKPNECRDCVCDGFGDPQYTTFDRKNYTFNGNCTYVASRDVGPHGKHEFQVLVTNVQCQDEPVSACTAGVFIEYQDHRVHLRRKKHELEAFVDGHRVHKFPLVTDWLRMEHMPGTEVSVLIPPLQLEVSYYFHSYAFAVRLPSHTFGHRTEGLCGNCNGDDGDDMRTRNGTITSDPNEFGLSWLHPLVSETGCTVPPEFPCKPLPPDEDPCFDVLDEERFGECHPLVDPNPYVAACQYDHCHSIDKKTSSCRDLEAYARACLQVGVCLNWRSNTSCPHKCPKGLQYRACTPACAPTCDNLKKLSEDPNACGLSQVDGCSCPDGQVLINGVCKDTKYCFPCDDEGHVRGQIWSPDNCTTCTCSKDGKVECLKKDCSAEKTVCGPHMQAVVMAGTEHDCCPKHICIPVPATTPFSQCPEPEVPLCGDDQELDVITDERGCKSFVCKCKPCVGEVGNELDPSLLEDAEQMDQRTTPVHRGPGWEPRNKTTGCCVRVEWVCNVDACPAPEPCAPHFSTVELPVPKGECCPQYKCEPPKNACLYEFQHIADINGGERQRKKDERFVTVKQPGAVWDDGPCRSCVCEGSAAGGFHPSCKVETCSEVLAGQEAVDYVLKRIPVPDQCCPRLERVACKEGATTHQVGSKWASPSGDPCETFVCDSVAERAEKRQLLEHCTLDCQPGFEEDKPPPGECCGRCRQVACVVDGQLKDLNSSWTSADMCTTSYCLLANDSYVVQSVVERCPRPPAEMELEYELHEELVPNKCCKKFVPVACKVGDKVYKEGETWPSPDGDPCKTFTCVRGSDGVSKQENTMTCNTECALGWKYSASRVARQCCGKCEQVACVVGDRLHQPGDAWSSDQGCTNHTCDNITLTVLTHMTTCPSVLDCDASLVYNDGCCDRCKETPVPSLVVNGSCKAENVPLEETVGLIKTVRKTHGTCINKDAIPRFTHCNGLCHSRTVFNAVTRAQENDCKCCQPVQLRQFTVDLTCEDASTLSVEVSVPSACQCEACGTSLPKENENLVDNTPIFMKEGRQ
ncbi:hemocytin isoform X2 [Periplaneta americana]|uniref:hemocytin isoform X2 n=1 Tax=Periplaneta americana TaxID=6978 RepID=UPI0037E8943F